MMGRISTTNPSSTAGFGYVPHHINRNPTKDRAQSFRLSPLSTLSSTFYHCLQLAQHMSSNLRKILLSTNEIKSLVPLNSHVSSHAQSHINTPSWVNTRGVLLVPAHRNGAYTLPAGSFRVRKQRWELLSSWGKRASHTSPSSRQHQVLTLSCTLLEPINDVTSLQKTRATVRYEMSVTHHEDSCFILILIHKNTFVLYLFTKNSQIYSTTGSHSALEVKMERQQRKLWTV